MKKIKNTLSIVLQSILWSCGVAWHNTYRDECTPDFNCCNNFGRKKFIQFKDKKCTPGFEVDLTDLVTAKKIEFDLKSKKIKK